jgi:hypothetical protein
MPSLGLFLSMEFKEYIFGNSPLSDRYFANIFSYFMACLLDILPPFGEQTVLI